MDLDLYGRVIGGVEHIIRGIAEKVEAITREEWLNGYFGGAPNSNASEEGIISFNKFIYRQQLERQPEHQLLFESVDIAKARISKAFSYIKECSLAFDTLELVFYALVSMIYFSMRKREAKEIEEIDIYIRGNIEELTGSKAEKEYLEILNSLNFLSMAYLYNSINGDENDWVPDDEQYRKDFKNLLSKAKQLIPKGEIVELINEIFVVEEFFKNPIKENIDRVNRLCFEKKENWMWHIFGCSSPQMNYEIQDRMHYLPHVTFCNSPDIDWPIMKHILDKIPQRIKGHWGIPTQEELEREDTEFNEKLEEWEKESYKRIFMQPYQIYTEFIYSLLAVLSENRILEETKNSIVSDFTHSYGNYEIDNVYNIAKALNENPSKEELEDYGRDLLLEYLNKQMMTKEIKMLKLEHKDSFEELRDAIINSIDFSGQGIPVYEIINEALKRVILRILLEEGSKRIDDIINKYENKEMDTYELLEQFEKSVIRGDEDCIDWVQKNMNSLHVEISSEWKKISFIRNSEGNVFLMSLFMELLFNMFTYASIDYDMNLILNYEHTDDADYFVVRTENIVDESIMSNTKKGLSARNRILSKINYGGEYRWKNSILKEYRKNNTECVVSARIKSDLFGGTR